MIKNFLFKTFSIVYLFYSHFLFSEEFKMDSSSFNSEQIAQYEKFEFTFYINQIFKNPFDPDEANVIAIFIDSNGNQMKIPAFYYQDCQRELSGLNEKVQLTGNTAWKVRFAPVILGEYKFDVFVNNQKINPTPLKFTCIQGEEKGFVNISNKNKTYFSFTNGEFYYPIGHNVRFLGKDQFTSEIPVQKGSFLIEEMFNKMSLNGENFCAIGMEAWWLGLEWTSIDDNDFGGIGKYNLKNAWMLDKIIDKAFERDIYLGLFLTSHGQYAIKNKKWPDGIWDKNPYNVDNGGFLPNPNVFFKNPEAIKSYKKLIRYIIARWGYSPHIFSWLLLSEADITQVYLDKLGSGKWEEALTDLGELTSWHKEIAQYIKLNDPYRHLVSTSFAFISHGGEIWKLPEMDFVFNTAFISEYGDNLVDLVKSYNQLSAPYNKPYLLAEYGGHARGNDEVELGGQFYCGIWAQYMNPKSPGSTGFWWWSFIESKDLYKHYKGLADYNLGEEQYLGNFVSIEDIKISDNMVGAMGKMLKDRHYLWFFENTIRYSIIDIGARKNVFVTYKPISGGKFKIEFWNTSEGEIISETSTLTALDGTLKFKLPDFIGDIACKAIRIRDDE
ncbi:MAG: hypothetical protein ACD_79C00238G0002 [uncultured bacterium]|nr:MAG: hypothetical protein ACD_79C00238G0002 [uncultured bacterium]